MKSIRLILLWALFSSCSFPSANVRHEHAERWFVTGAEVELKQDSLFNVFNIKQGNYSVLIVRDSDSRKGWTDSGTNETLVIEIPASGQEGEWQVGDGGARVWSRRGSAWGEGEVKAIDGWVRAHRTGGGLWSIRVEISGTLEWNRTESRATSVRHTFVVKAVPFERFSSDLPAWTE